MPTAKGNPVRPLTEKQWQAQVVKLARLCGYILQYHTYDSRRSSAGFPDLVLISMKQKRVLFVELKSDTGKLSSEQEDWAMGLKIAEAEYYCWRPRDIEEAYKILKGET